MTHETMIRTLRQAQETGSAHIVLTAIEAEGIALALEHCVQRNQTLSALCAAFRESEEQRLAAQEPEVTQKIRACRTAVRA